MIWLAEVAGGAVRSWTLIEDSEDDRPAARAGLRSRRYGAGMTIATECEACGTRVEGADLRAFGDAYIAHARASHPEWPYPNQALRNYAEATQGLTGRYTVVSRRA